MPSQRDTTISTESGYSRCRRSHRLAGRFSGLCAGNTTEYGREEALYNLAVVHADNGGQKAAQSSFLSTRTRRVTILRQRHC